LLLLWKASPLRCQDAHAIPKAAANIWEFGHKLSGYDSSLSFRCDKKRQKIIKRKEKVL
jgi:hypothetical protein